MPLPSTLPIRDALGLVGVVKWWHGKGSFLDYTNPSVSAVLHVHPSYNWCR